MYRKTLIIISIFLFSVQFMFAQSTKKIDLSLQNVTLKEFLSAIEKETDYTFMYSNIDLKQISNITIKVKQNTVEQILKQVLPVRNISYEISGSRIILRESRAVFGQMSAGITDAVNTSEPARITIAGTVTDALGDPLIGVSVMVQGASVGTITDMDGNYTINVINDRSQIKFSYIGYNDQIITVGQQRNISIVMTESSKALDEVVVVGYGTVKKTSLTAAVSTLKGSTVSQKPVTNLSNTFVGNIAGVIAQQSSGEPGSDGSTLRIRGNSTLGNGDPLLIVDGVQRSFSKLDPNSIESFTVLKDAAAVAPYGMGGANGVILVTTKRGKLGAPTLSYNGYVGIQNATRMPKMVNSYQYALLQNEGARNSGLLNMPFSDSQIEQYRKTVDGVADANPDMYPNSRGLRDVVKKNSLITQHNLELTGGTEFVKYYASLGYQDVEGQFENINSKKYNGQLSIDIQATKTTKVSASVTGYVTQYNFPGKTDATAGIMYQGFRTPPTSAIYYSNGLWGSYIGQSLVGYIHQSGYLKKDETQIYTTFSIEQQLPFIKGLSLKGLVSYDPQTYNFKNWQTPVLSYAPDFSTDPVTYNEVYTQFTSPQLNEEYSDRKTFTYQAHINYVNKFGLHDISLLAVAEAREQKNKNLSAERKNFPLNIDEIGMGGVGQGDIANGGGSWRSSQAGFVFRGAYNYAGKYFVELAGRYDGSYYFAPGKRWGFFPSASLAWNISQENFIADKYSWIDIIKLRTSYGSSGSLAGSDFQYLSGYELYGNATYFNGSPTIGIAELKKQPNVNITWEKAQKFDIGTDVSLWNGLLTFQFDYFHEKRSDMLLAPQVLVPVEYGAEMPQVNSGKMSNQGIEFALGSTHRVNKDLTLQFNGNFTFAKNKIIERFETSSTYNNPNRRRTGRSNGTQFGYKALGYFTPDDFTPDGKLKPGIASIPDAPVQPGDLKYADMNDDGKIDSNDETVIGYPNGMPQIIYGFTPGISYKGFDVSLLFQGAARISLPVGGSLVRPFDQQGSATVLAYKDHWTPDNPNALYPRVYSNQPSHNTEYSSWWCRDASYLRLKNMEIGYTLPYNISKKAAMQRIRVYLSGQNLWTWTPNIKEKLDPEAQSSNGQYYYQQQVFSFGLNVTF